MQYVVAGLVGLVLAEVATLITTIYLHRVLSHKAIHLHPALTMLMRLGTWMLTSISPREWVAVHRKHHNFSDVEGDPHSPHIEGYWQIMLANVYYYRREANNDDTLEKYASDLPFDRLDKLLLRRGTFELLLDGCDPSPDHGLRTRSRRTRHARGRVPGAERGDQRRRPHLRLQELRQRRDEPQAPRPHHLREACTTTTTHARPRRSSPPLAASSTRRGL